MEVSDGAYDGGACGEADASGAAAGDRGETSDLALIREQCDRMERKLDRLTALSEEALGAGVAAEAEGAARDVEDGTCTAGLGLADASQPLCKVWSASAVSDKSKPTEELELSTAVLPEALESAAPTNSHEFVASTLPLDWPAVLSIRQGFLASSPATSSRWSASRRKSAGSISEFSSELPGVWPEDAGTVRANRFMIDPNSRFHMVYSLCSLLVLFYDLTLLPYTLAWELEYTGWLQVSTLCTSVFWSLDIIITFLTGRYQAGELYMKFRSVARFYLRSWFFPDIVVVISDWVGIMLSEIANGDPSGRSFTMLRFMKLGRLLRIIGMVRMLRVVRIFEDFAERTLSEGYRVAFNMVSLFGCIMWVAHILSCAWFAVGKAGPSDTGARWTDDLYVLVGDEEVPYLQTSPLYQYTVAFHWAAGQVALGNFECKPTNSLERIVFVFAMMVGFLFGSTLVSLLSAAMMDYRMMQKDRNMKLRTLRQYLRQSGVGPSIAMSVQKQASQRLTRRICLEEKDVPALSLLSTALRSQLRFEMQRPHLLQHPVLRLWTSLDSGLMQKACMKAIGLVQLRPKDDLFAAGTAASAAYSLVKGELMYVQHPDSSPVEVETKTTVRPGCWLCEAALWTEWTHVGRAEAVRSSTVLQVKSEELLESLREDVFVKDLAAEYCRHFHKRVTAARPPHAPWPSDLEVPYTDYCDMVVCMAKEAQVTIGLDALSQLTRGHRTSKAMDKLAEEVRTAKSIVVVTGEGSIIRVVSLVALRVERTDRRVFAQIGKWDGSHFEADCRLPALKQERGELVRETVGRMLSTKLQLLAGRVEVEAVTRQHEERMSQEYGVQTRYLRSVCRGRLLDEHDALDAPVLLAREQSPTSPRSTASLRKSLSLGPDMAVMRTWSGQDGSGRMPPMLPSWSGPEDGGLLAGLLSTEVLQVPSGGGEALYAWLQPEAFDLLSGGAPAGLHALKAWLAELPPPEKQESELAI